MGETAVSDNWTRSLDSKLSGDMPSTERFNIVRELELMLADFWFDVDTNYGRRAGEFYTEDGVFVTSSQTYRGREMIQAFYKFREDQGPRTAAHTFTNFRVNIESPTRATTRWYLILYAHNGEPILAAAPPIQIGLSTDICEKGLDGVWRYKHRKFETWFKGGVATPSPNLG